MRIIVSLTILALLFSLTPSTRADVEAILLRVEEDRATTFVKDNFSRPPNRLTVQLALHGPEAEAATAYGDVHFDEAVDDQGRNLIPQKDDSAPYIPFQNVFFRTIAKKQHEKPAAPWAYLNLTPAERSAKRIARLRGTLNLVSYGAPQAVETSGVKSAGMVAMQTPRSAGIQVTLRVVPDMPRSLKVTVTGDKNMLTAMEVFGADGQKIESNLAIAMQEGRSMSGYLELRQPVDDSMKFVAKVAENRHVTPVTFDLKDVALP